MPFFPPRVNPLSDSSASLSVKTDAKRKWDLLCRQNTAGQSASQQNQSQTLFFSVSSISDVFVKKAENVLYRIMKCLISFQSDSSPSSPVPQALVRCAEDVIHTLAEVLPVSGQSRERWVLHLERLKDKLHSTVNFILQTLRAVSSYHHYFNKVRSLLWSRDHPST